MTSANGHGPHHERIKQRCMYVIHIRDINMPLKHSLDGFIYYFYCSLVYCTTLSRIKYKMFIFQSVEQMKISIPYFSDYKMHIFLHNLGGNGGASYSSHVAYLAHCG